MQRRDMIWAALVALLIGGTGVWMYRTSLRLNVLASEIGRLKTSVGASVVRRGAAVTEVTSTPLSIKGAPKRGRPDAPLALVEYSDFQCPFCTGFALNTLPEITARYVVTGKVRFVFKHYPLERAHPLAPLIAQGSLCAEEQGRFWSFHDDAFRSRESLTEERMTRIGRDIGLDAARFRSCLSNTATRDHVVADTEEAKRFGITGTPAFLIGRLDGDVVHVMKRVNGARPFGTFEQVLEEVARQISYSRRAP